jgi:hypothetical protein
LRATGVKLDFTIDSREQRVILSSPYIITSMEACASLSDDNAACRYFLPAKYFYSEPFTFGIATVSGTAASFFVCHISLLSALDTCNFHFGVPLSVASLVAIVLATIELNDANLLMTTV